MLKISDVVALEKIKNPNNYFNSKAYERDKNKKSYFVIKSATEGSLELVPVEDLENSPLDDKKAEYEFLKRDTYNLDEALANFLFPRLLLFKEFLLKDFESDLKSIEDLLFDIDTMIVGFGLMLDIDYIVEGTKNSVDELYEMLVKTDGIQSRDSAFHLFKENMKKAAFEMLAKHYNDLWR